MTNRIEALTAGGSAVVGTVASPIGTLWLWAALTRLSQ